MTFGSLLALGLVLMLAIAGGIALAPFMGTILMFTIGLAACSIALALILAVVEWLLMACNAFTDWLARMQG